MAAMTPEYVTSIAGRSCTTWWTGRAPVLDLVGSHLFGSTESLSVVGKEQDFHHLFALQSDT